MFQHKNNVKKLTADKEEVRLEEKYDITNTIFSFYPPYIHAITDKKIPLEICKAMAMYLYYIYIYVCIYTEATGMMTQFYYNGKSL